MKIKKYSAGLVLGALVAGGAVLGMQSASAATCALVANKPTYASGTLSGVGGRVSCPDGQNTEVVLKKDRNGLPDSVLASSAMKAWNATWTVSAVNPGGGAFYVETISATGAKLQSSRLNR